MATLYYDKDADLGLLKGKTIGIIGYGSQGHAHALNHRDSGLDVMVGLYKGSKSWDKAKEDGLKVGTVAETAEASQVVMILLPGSDPQAGVRGVHPAGAAPGQDPDVRPRLQHPLQPDRAARRTWTSP